MAQTQIPTSALVTSCIEGCDSRIEWTYVEAEYRYPREPDIPDYFVPERGCIEEHLSQLGDTSPWGRLTSESHEQSLGYQFYTYTKMLEGAYEMEQHSRRYLNAYPYRRTNRFYRRHPVPRLRKLVQWVAILSTGEADACIRDYRAGYDYSGEAVNHFGGTRAVITRAVAMRCALRDIWERERRELLAETTWDRSMAEYEAEYNALQDSGAD